MSAIIVVNWDIWTLCTNLFFYLFLFFLIWWKNRWTSLIFMDANWKPPMLVYPAKGQAPSLRRVAKGKKNDNHANYTYFSVKNYIFWLVGTNCLCFVGSLLLGLQTRGDHFSSPLRIHRFTFNFRYLFVIYCL